MFRGRDASGFEVEVPTFTRKVTYEDGESATPSVVIMTDDDSNYQGSLAFARRLSRKIGNYDGGVTSFHTRSVDGKDFIAFVPLPGWLDYCEDPLAVAARLEEAGEELVKRWKARNLQLIGEKRKPVSWADEITRYEWRNSSGKKETTVYEIQLNTFSLNKNHQNRRRPVVSSDEIKVLIKARTSVDVENRADKSNVGADGLAQDNKGYNNYIRHFVGYLRSPECAEQLREAREAKGKKAREDHVRRQAGRDEEEEEEEEEGLAE